MIVAAKCLSKGLGLKRLKVSCGALINVFSRMEMISIVDSNNQNQENCHLCSKKRQSAQVGPTKEPHMNNGGARKSLKIQRWATWMFDKLRFCMIKGRQVLLTMTMDLLDLL